MDPGRAHLHAFFALQFLWMFDMFDRVKMRAASFVHELFGIPVVCCCQPDLNSGHGHAAFANCSGAAFDRSGAHVTSCKNSRQARLEWTRLMLARAPGWRVDNGRAGFDESFVVTLDFRR